MEKDDVIEFLENRLEKMRRDEPYAVNPIRAYEAVIEYLGNED